MTRPPCNRLIPGGVCVELSGHKSMCRTAEQLEKYEAQMAALDPRNRRRTAPKTARWWDTFHEAANGTVIGADELRAAMLAAIEYRTNQIARTERLLERVRVECPPCDLDAD